MKRLCFVWAILLLIVPESRAEKKAISFNASDGATLKGAFYTTGKAGPGVLLLHQCNADHQLYDSLGVLLSTAGYNVLAFDFRGPGQSKQPMPGDVDAALKFLTSQPNVNSNA